MNQIVVRYKIKPDQIQENTRFIEGLFAEMNAKRPEGLRYLCVLLEDGTYVHFVQMEEGATKVSDLDAFAPYQEKLKERLLAAPEVADATIVGNYHVLGTEHSR